MIPLDNRNIALKRYYLSIRNYLPSSRKLKTKVLAEIENNINTYLLENPSADIVSIKARFGEPEQIAAAYVDALGTPELLKKLHVRKSAVAIIVSAVAIILVLWLGVVGWSAITEYYDSNGDITDSGIVEILP